MTLAGVSEPETEMSLIARGETGQNKKYSQLRGGRVSRYLASLTVYFRLPRLIREINENYSSL